MLTSASVKKEFTISEFSCTVIVVLIWKIYVQILKPALKKYLLSHSFYSVQELTLTKSSQLSQMSLGIFFFCCNTVTEVTVTTMYLFRAVFWVVLPCKMIVDRRFRGAYCLHHHTRRRENLKSHNYVFIYVYICFGNKYCICSVTCSTSLA
jgi:hypothetical protein